MLSNETGVSFYRARNTGEQRRAKLRHSDVQIGKIGQASEIYEYKSVHGKELDIQLCWVCAFVRDYNSILRWPVTDVDLKRQLSWITATPPPRTYTAAHHSRLLRLE